MIQINKLTDEISEKRSLLDNDGHTMKKSEVKKTTNRIIFLKQSIAYLEQNNREEFLTKELDRLKNRINLINVGFTEWVPNKYFEKEKDKLREYWKECGVPKLKMQIKALHFLLNK